MNKTLINIALLISGIILFALPQPSFMLIGGLPFLAYFAYIPIFILVRRLEWKFVWLYGMLYGIGCYCLFTNWLATFHPMGILVISFLYGLELLITFPFLKLATTLFKKNGWIVQWIVWCAYEFLKTKGFAGFHYGVTAYSHWHWTTFIQCADIIGVWGLSAIITFPSAWLSEIFYSNFNFKKFFPIFLQRAKQHIVSISLWVLCFISIIVYGLVSPVDYSQNETRKVALLQSNSDPWVGGTTTYQKDLNTLMGLSDEALAENPDIDFIVWPETAFVPRIKWHYQKRTDRVRFELVNNLLTYINSKNVPFLIGNDDGVMGYNRLGEYDVVDYNAVLLFRPGENVIPPNPEVYHKMHLVPFTEWFPFEKLFPKVYELLLNGDTHMWEPGTNPVVFDVAGLKVCTPICFEDTFGYIGRRFVNNGANAIVNMSNDAWSKSLACQYQHLSMAVFRAVENRIPSMRSTSSGQTVIIDPNGKVLAMAEPFKETYLVGDVPVMDVSKKTIYTLFGDYIGYLFVFLASSIILTGSIYKLYRKRRRVDNS
jgi:apolipoprotein N-acyltransferase